MIRLWNSWDQIQLCIIQTQPTVEEEYFQRISKVAFFFFTSLSYKAQQEPEVFTLTERAKNVQITFHGCKQKSPGQAASHVTLILRWGHLYVAWHKMLHIISHTESTENYVFCFFFWWKFRFASITQAECCVLISCGECSSSPALQLLSTM